MCYDDTMRTTITLDEDVFDRLKEVAHQAGIPFKQVVNETLRRGIAVDDVPPRKRRYRVNPSSLGGVLPGRNLDRALRLADSLEDEAIASKLEARK
jgi:hypothetical protein